MFFNKSPHQKFCSQCKTEKSFSLYHKDSSSKDGHSTKCAECRNTLKRIAKSEPTEKAITMPQVKPKAVQAIPQPKPIKNEARAIPVTQESILTELSKKFNCPFSISINRKGHARLQVHSVPNLTWTAQTPESLLQQVLV